MYSTVYYTTVYEYSTLYLSLHCTRTIHVCVLYRILSTSNISAFKSQISIISDSVKTNYDYSHFENFKRCDMPDNFKIEFYLLIIDSINDDFSQRFDQESMQFFHLA